MQYDGYLHSCVIIGKKRPDSDEKKRKTLKSVIFAIRFPTYCWHNCITALRKFIKILCRFHKMQETNKNLQKSVDKSPRRQYNNTCKQRSYTNTKSSCGSFCFKRDCKSSAVSAKAQRGADRIFSDPFQEKSGTAAVRKLPIERGGYQWISYPR